MSYTQFQPHALLSDYIDAYWTMKGDQTKSVQQRIYPDGCIDIIVNLGNEFLANNGTFTMQHQSAYLVGTMTRFIDITIHPDTCLLGIRFKPLGFSTFYKFSSLHEITNRTVKFDQQIPEIHLVNLNTIRMLDKFFVGKVNYINDRLSQIMKEIKSKKGLVSIEQLTRQYFISERQLERNFKQLLGISPKEYAGFIRYQSAMEAIQAKPVHQNLLDIALDNGFYDRAHLHSEIKKYSGHIPSQLQNVGFLQTADDERDLDLMI